MFYVFERTGMIYLATFFSHFGAISFRRLCREKGIEVELMPVPRFLSSSCGTCARFSNLEGLRMGTWPEEVERVVALTGENENSYSELYVAQGL